MKILTKNQNQTKKIGEDLAKEILKEAPRKKAFVLVLEGDLGGGKTTFLQGFARGLEIKDRILSPTFVLMKRFAIKKKNKPGFTDFYHFDCYRVKNHKDILALGFEEIVSDPHNVIAVEWAERIKKIIPKDAVIFKFEFINKTTRRIIF